jgi:hypothetical protein
MTAKDTLPTITVSPSSHQRSGKNSVLVKNQTSVIVVAACGTKPYQQGAILRFFKLFSLDNPMVPPT